MQQNLDVYGPDESIIATIYLDYNVIVNNCYAKSQAFSDFTIPDNSSELSGVIMNNNKNQFNFIIPDNQSELSGVIPKNKDNVNINMYTLSYNKINSLEDINNNEENNQKIFNTLDYIDDFESISQQSNLKD